MGRRVEQSIGGAKLDDPSSVHHRDAAADLAHEPQIVRDEEIGQAQSLLQIE
jgi:hypothetical protein